MKSLREIIKLLVPPIFMLAYRFLKKNDLSCFSGVYTSVDEVHDENPWVQEPWIEISKAKLKHLSDVSLDSFMPTPDFLGYPLIPCLIVNLLSQSHLCNVLEFGGGTGFVFFKAFPYLINPGNVMYHVVDQNTELYQIGAKHAESMGNENRIIFHREMPKKEEIQLDVLYINSSLQYINDFSSLLLILLQYKPKYVILTRLLAGDMKTYITCQNICGYTTPCVFINFDELIDVFLKNGFNLFFKSPCVEEVLKERYDDNIPENLRILHSSNIIFKKNGLDGS